MNGDGAKKTDSREECDFSQGGWQDMWTIGSYLSWVAVKNNDRFTPTKIDKKNDYPKMFKSIN